MNKFLTNLCKQSFGKYLRECREESGLSVRRLAIKLGLSHSYISDIERGKCAPLAEYYWWLRLSKFLKVDFEKLSEYQAKYYLYKFFLNSPDINFNKLRKIIDSLERSSIIN